LGDRINTDYIIASSRKKETLDPHVLSRWLLEAVDPDFASSVLQGDILVAGDAFGCGSAMEVAVTVVQAAGIRAVVARSFSRTYFRNAINNGLVPVECETGLIRDGDRISVRAGVGGVDVVDHDQAMTFPAAPIPSFALEILKAGGLVAYLRDGIGFSGNTT
jgi:3-isopropylmalate/(R)-2-methylmalate dehydratase small subunit